MSIRILTGDCRDVMRGMGPESVDCIVTSPPYWGLRDYGTAGQLGLEATLGEHIAAMVDVFEDARRVLKKTGTLWLNYGDCYAASVNGRSAAATKANGQDDRTFRDKPFSTVGPIFRPGNPEKNGGNSNQDGVRVDRESRLKPKDLCMVPNRLAIALQEAGWWVRSEIIWAKPNPMPESVRDRPTSSHEKIWLLTKNERYFYDAEAIAEEALQPLGDPLMASGRGTAHKQYALKRIGVTSLLGANSGNAMRNRRNVWTVPSQPFSDAHFATFPPALIEPCVLAGCPQKCCAKCGKPWVRKTATEFIKLADRRPTRKAVQSGADMADINSKDMMGYNQVITLGFRPSCHCKADTVPGVVLDPFGGAGTTGMVADRLGRNAILIELNAKYAAMAQARIVNDLPLFAEVLA